jgi:hypothetical protein
MSWGNNNAADVDGHWEQGCHHTLKSASVNTAKVLNHP